MSTMEDIIAQAKRSARMVQHAREDAESASQQVFVLRQNNTILGVVSTWELAEQEAVALMIAMGGLWRQMKDGYWRQGVHWIEISAHAVR
jgi:hypothetical protein